MRERHRRSILKTISWRILATFTTTMIVYLLTGRLLLSIGIGSIEAVTKMILYYGHERFWGVISWGREEK